MPGLFLLAKVLLVAGVLVHGGAGIDVVWTMTSEEHERALLPAETLLHHPTLWYTY